MMAKTATIAMDDKDDKAVAMSGDNTNGYK